MSIPSVMFTQQRKKQDLFSFLFFFLKQTKLSDRIILTGFRVSLFHAASVSDDQERESKCFVALPFSLFFFLLEDLLLWKLFLPLCARSTSECFDSCRLSAEISMRTEHRQWGLMKQRGCCEADGSCVASSLPHNQSVTASICPPDTHASIWKNSILVAWLHTLCLLSRWRHGDCFAVLTLCYRFSPLVPLVFFFGRISGDLGTVFALDLSDKTSEACLHCPQKCTKLIHLVLEIDFSFIYVEYICFKCFQAFLKLHFFSWFHFS